MSVIRLAGMRTSPLASYLAALGLARVLAEQVDPDLRSWWANDVAHVDTCVDDIPTWLVEHYRPTPILSPWNEGSGYGRKDKTSRQMLDALLKRHDSRLDDFRAAHAVAADIGERSRQQGWDKHRTVRELRNRCPERLLDWIDASVVLAGDGTVFPPLLGTGGNDGRLDFSTTFHQRLLDVLPQNNAERERSLFWATDALFGGRRTALQPSATGQFDPFAAGGKNSSVFGDGRSLVNPWAFVLLVEGALLFASGVSRRLGSVRRAAVPFTVLRTSANELGAGVDGESSRGEVWAPVWHDPLTWMETRQLFREARASWRGKAVTAPVQMYEATRSFGVARGIDQFKRYGLHQRNGLAFVAVPLDTVDVHERQEVRLAAPIEDWLDHTRRASSSFGVGAALRRAERAHLAFARDGGGRALTNLLSAVTALELAIGRSRGAAEALAVSHPSFRAGDYLEVCYAQSPTPEVRIAASIASAACPDEDSQTSGRALREILLPLEPSRTGRPEWGRPRVEGFGNAPLVDVLADAMIWRAQHWSNREGTVGLVPWPYGLVQAPPADVHAWARGELDEAQVERHVTAFLALDWRGARAPWGGDERLTSEEDVPIPLLAMLQAFRSGALRRIGDDDTRVGLELDWPMRLRSGRDALVAGDVIAALRRCGWLGLIPRRAPELDGSRLLAALVPAAAQPLRTLARLCERLQPDEDVGTGFNMSTKSEEIRQ